MNDYQLLVIKGELQDLNTYVNENRKHWSKGSKSKSTETEVVEWLARTQKLKPMGSTPFITYRWMCKNKKKDKDNISFAKKFINDGLKNAGILDGDGWKHIGGFKDEFEIDPINPRVEVYIYYGESGYNRQSISKIRSEI